MKKILFITVLLSLLMPAQWMLAQAPTVDYPPTISWTEIYDECISASMSSDGTKMLAAVVSGRLYNTTDGGTTWIETQPAGDTTLTWISVSISADGSVMLAGIENGRIYRSTDGGLNWSETQPAEDADYIWQTLSVSSNGSVMLAGVLNGRLYKSTNSGSSWVETRPAGLVGGDEDSEWKSVSISNDGSKMLACINNGRIYLSNAGSWSQIQPAGDVDESWSTVSVSQDGGTMLAGVGGGRLYNSTDGGTTWDETQPAGNIDQSWQTAALSANGNTMLAGVSPGRLYTSTDGGTTWAETRPAGNYDAEWNTTALFADGSNMLAGINEGELFQTVPDILTTSNITSTTATGHGRIFATNGADATNRGIIYYPFTDTDKIIGGTDVTNISETGTFGIGNFTASLTGLTPNTHYNIRAHATNASGTGYSDRADFWTLANVPDAPTVSNPGATTLDVAVNANGNPPGTEFAIHEISSGFIQADGSLGSTAVWQTATTWGTISAGGLTPGVTYTFKVKARNSENTETEFGAGASGMPMTTPKVIFPPIQPWAEADPPGTLYYSWHDVSMTSDGSMMFAANNYPGKLFKSTDGAVTWSEIQPIGGTGSSEAWTSISVSADGSMMLATYWYYVLFQPTVFKVFKSTNFGTSWTEIQPAGPGTHNWWTSCVSPDGSRLIVGGSTGRLYLSSDGGVNWAEVQPAGNVDGKWNPLCISEDNNKMIVGNYGQESGAPTGRLYMSTDGGTSWSEIQPAGTVTKRWISVAMTPDGSTIIAAADGGRIYKSTDGGTNWIESQPAGNADKKWRTVSISSDGTLMLAGIRTGSGTGRLYQSTDGGTSWIEVQPGGNVTKDWFTTAISSDGDKMLAGSYGQGLYRSDAQLLSVSNIAPTSATGHGKIVNLNGGGNATNRGVVYYPFTDTDKIIGDAGVTNVSESGSFGIGEFTASLTGLSVNAHYNIRAHASNSVGIAYTERADFWTLANVPSAPTLNNPTNTTLNVAVNANGNPAITEFAIHETTTGYFLQANGTFGETTVWATASTWGTKTITGLTSGTTYTFEVKARNAINTETAYGPQANGKTTGPTCYAGQFWMGRSAAEANAWKSVTYGNGVFVAVAQSGTNRVMTSTDGITWTARSAAEANSWNSVTYGTVDGNPLFVAVAESGTNRVMTSPDGITWTARTAAEANTWNSVTYGTVNGNPLFVAVAQSGTNRVMTSPDGITWTARSAVSADYWYSVTYGNENGNGLFVAVSSAGTNKVMTSPDGITWTARTAAEANSWRSVTYGNGLFVAVSQDGTNRVMTSPDGITWTARTASEANSWISITYGNGLFVAVSTLGTNRIMTSPSGIVWTARTAAETNNWNSATYGNGVFVAVAGNGTNRVMTSDCSNPLPTIQASEINFTSIAATSFTINWTNGDGASRAVFVKEGTGAITNPGDNTTYTASADWASKGTQLGTSGYYCVYNGTGNAVSLSNLNSDTQYTVQVFEYKGSAGTEKYLTTTATNNPNSQETSICYAGQFWTAQSAAEANSWQSVTYGNGLFVAVANSGTNQIMTSLDGVTWTARAATEAIGWQSVTYGNGLFVAVANYGTNRVMTSPDGITWTARTASAANSWNSVTYGNGLFVAVAGSGTNRVMTSPDGINWTTRNATEISNWFAVNYGNGLFVAVATTGTNRLMTSPDGITWTTRTISELNNWYSVTYGNGLFVAVSQNGTNRVMTSPDGITWTPRSASAVSEWNSVTFGNGLFVAVAGSGANQVMTSPDGINWTSRTASEANLWFSVTYGNGLFVAVSLFGTNLVMTSDCTNPALTVTTQAASANTTTTATGNGNITNTGSGNATDRGVIYYPFTNTDKEIGGIDVTNVSETGSFGTGTFTAAFTDLSVNTHYNARAHATNAGDGTKYGDRIDFWTLANVPAAPTVNNPGSTTLDVAVNVNGNPTDTEFAIHETSTGNFIQANSSLGPGAIWQTATTWGTKKVNGLTTGTEYTFEVKARNGGNTETAYGATASGTPVGAPTVTTQTTSDITASSATGNGNVTSTGGINPTVRGIIYWLYTNTDKIIGDADVTDVPENGSPDFGTGAFTRSLTGLTVNTRYNTRAYATNSEGTGYSSRTDFWTLANVPAAPTVNNPSSTTLDVAVNGNGNPTDTEFAIHETSTGNFLQANGSLGAGAIWQTATTWGTKQVNGLTTGTEYTFEVKARNGGNTETAFGATASGTAVGVPSISITSPLQKAMFYVNPVTVSGTASDPDNNLSIIEVKTTDGTWQTATGTSSWTIGLNLLPGKNTIEARAKDATNVYSDIASVTVTLSVQVISIPQGWSYISSYLDPNDDNIVNMWADIVGANHLGILTGVNGIYAPAPFYINTLGSWDVMKGYKVKMAVQDELIVSGDSLTDKTVTFPAGVHLIPVLTNQTTPLDEVFDNPATDILYMLDIYTNQVYWPNGVVYTLTDLVPGKGYLANFKNPVTLSYPPMNNFTVTDAVALPPAPGPWACTRTSNVHLISVSVEAISQLQNADYIGAFDSQGNCVGYAKIEKSETNLLLTIYGDEPMTPENDGLAGGEVLRFRSYRLTDNAEKELTPIFNPSFPNTDGLFYTNGLSGIIGFKESATGVGEKDLATGVNVYPNPATDVVNITGLGILEGFGTLMNAEGKVVKTFSITSPEIQLNVEDLHRGIYLLKLETEKAVVIKRVVIQ